MKLRWAVGVTLLAIVIYLPILRNGFVFDDHGLIEENTTLREISNIPSFFTSDIWAFYYPEYQTKRVRYWRPLTLSVWAVVYQLFELNPIGYHLLSIISHAACTLLVFLVGKEMLSGGERTAGIAAAIFALHPVHIDAVGWANALSDVLLACFVVVTVWTYHRYRARKDLRSGIATLAFLGLSLLSKETGIMVVAVLVAYELLLASREGRAGASAVLATGFLVVLCYLWVHRMVMGPMDVKFPSIPFGNLILTLTVVSGHYARLLLFPLHLVATYPNHVYTHISEPDVLKALFFIAIMIGFLAMVIRSRTDVFWLLFIGLTLLPAFNVVGVTTDLLSERYLYLPSVGFCFLTAQFFDDRLTRLLPSRMVTALLAVLLCSYAVRDLTRFPDWRDELTYLTVTLRDAPNSFLHQNNLGSYYFNSAPRNLDGAEKAFQKSISLAPDYEHPHSNLALVYLEKGDPHKALHHASRALEIQPQWVEPLISAAEAAGRLGRVEEAKGFLEKALSLEPDNAMAHNNMGNVAYLQGNLEEAVTRWKKASELDPSNIQVLFNLALGYEKLGQREQAAHFYGRFAEEAPPEMDAARQRAMHKVEELGGRFK